MPTSGVKNDRRRAKFSAAAGEKPHHVSEAATAAYRRCGNGKESHASGRTSRVHATGDWPAAHTASRIERSASPSPLPRRLTPIFLRPEIWLGPAALARTAVAAVIWAGELRPLDGVAATLRTRRTDTIYSQRLLHGSAHLNSNPHAEKFRRISYGLCDYRPCTMTLLSSNQHNQTWTPDLS